MKIQELQPGNASLDEATVIEKSEVRTFEKFGRTGRVCTAVLDDGTGTLALTLWNDQVDQIQIGDKIRITNGWVKEWQGKLQISTGKNGTLEKLS